MRKPTREQKRRMCTGKRRSSSEGEALQGAQRAGVEHLRKAYLCTLCGKWHLSSR